jgi:hypothetical protein
MLAVFDPTVAKCPEGLRSPPVAGAAAAAGGGAGALMKGFSAAHDAAVTVSLGPAGALAYSAVNRNLFVPRCCALRCSLPRWIYLWCDRVMAGWKSESPWMSRLECAERSPGFMGVANDLLGLGKPFDFVQYGLLLLLGRDEMDVGYWIVWISDVDLMLRVLWDIV